MTQALAINPLWLAITITLIYVIQSRCTINTLTVTEWAYLRPEALPEYILPVYMIFYYKNTGMTLARVFVFASIKFNL